MKMETASLYEDERMMSQTQSLKGTMNMLRSQMTLDFNTGSPAKKKQLGQFLASPDLNMLKLASPELEKLIIQHNGMVTTTPTPTQILFPKSVTEEQEAYARGFMDALAKLHDGANEDTDTSDASKDSVPAANVKPDRTYTTLQNASHRLSNMPVTTTMGNYSFQGNFPSVQSSMSNSMQFGVPSTVNTNSPLNINTHDSMRTSSPFMNSMEGYKIKEEPQTVPSLDSSPPLSPMMSPINMDDQELQKLDRKRARNRIAARKCRYRKLERISKLEDRVNELKTHNAKLSADANALKEQVLNLKQQILKHVNSGCNIMMTNIV